MWNYAKSEIFASLLRPLGLEEFAEKYYERAPLWIHRAQAGFYGDYFSLAEAERILYGVQLTPAQLRMSKNGTKVRLESYTRKNETFDVAVSNAGGADVVDPYAVSNLFSQGCSIVVENLQRCSPSIAALTRKLEGFFGHDIFAGFFLTPPGSQGLPVHFDSMDTVVLQIEGRKRWRVYEPAIELPLREQEHEKRKPGALLLDIELQEGDLLYLPRGTFHEPTTGEGLYSLHVTFGLLPIRWYAVLERALLDAALQSSTLRRSTHSHLDRAGMGALIAHAFSDENLTRTLDEMESRFAAGHANDLSGQLRQVLDAGDLDLASVIRLREDAIYEIDEAGEAAVLKISGTDIPLPSGAIAILRDLAARGPVSLVSLTEHGDDAPAIVRRLIKAGLVTGYATADAPAVSAGN